MPRTAEGDLVLSLLSVRDKKDPEAIEIRFQASAALWAEERYRKLLETLAHGSYLHEELFPLFDDLKREELGGVERTCIEALGRRLGILLVDVVVLRQLNACGKIWWMACLDLAKLEEMLQAKLP